MKEYTIGDVLQLLRYRSFSRSDEGAKVILAPECEDWTHVAVSVNSGLLDELSDVVVETIDAVDDCVRLWLKTSDFTVPVKLEARDDG